MDLSNLRCDNVFFKLKTEKFYVDILRYVNDSVILRSVMSGVTWVKEKLGFPIKLTFLGQLRYYLGVSFEQKERKCSYIN